MADYRQDLFTLNGETPDFLPLRLRLPCGDTRYAYDVTLEELESCGYFGPISLPDFDSNCQKLVWDPTTNTFKIENQSEDYLTILDNIKYRNVLQDLLNSRDIAYRERLTEEGKVKFDAYYSEIVSLILSADYITANLIPSLNINTLDILDERKKLADSVIDHDYIEEMKFAYEYGGIITWDDEASSYLFDSLKDNFTIPSSWTPSGQLSDTQIKEWENSSYLSN